MIHSGGDSQRLPCQSVCGKAWSALPIYDSQHELCAPIDLLLHRMFQLFDRVSAGLVVASSDVLLLVPPGWTTTWPQQGATGLAIPTPAHYGPNHGVYQVAAAASGSTPSCAVVTHFWQKASVPALTAAGAVRASDGRVLLDTGVIYFSPPATALLLDLARTAPLDRCTYLGVDSDARPLRVELYSDIMMAMGGGMGLSREDYHATPAADPGPGGGGRAAAAAGTAPSHASLLKTARDVMWDALNGEWWSR